MPDTSPSPAILLNAHGNRGNGMGNGRLFDLFPFPLFSMSYL
jgi:hypothetical protein